MRAHSTDLALFGRGLLIQHWLSIPMHCPIRNGAVQNHVSALTKCHGGPVMDCQLVNVLYNCYTHSSAVHITMYTTLWPTLDKSAVGMPVQFWLPQVQCGVYIVHSVAVIICEMCSVENRWKSFPVRWQKGKETGWMQGPTETCNGIKLPFVIYFKHFFYVWRN